MHELELEVPDVLEELGLKMYEQLEVHEQLEMHEQSAVQEFERRSS